VFSAPAAGGSTKKSRVHATVISSRLAGRGTVVRRCSFSRRGFFGRAASAASRAAFAAAFAAAFSAAFCSRAAASASQ